MKENSIEEDIKIINNFITYFNKNIQNGNKADLTVLGVEINALEHILSDYIRVLKENEELKAKWDKDTHILQNELDLTNADKINNYIPVQKIKDKIRKNEEIIDISNDGDLIHELCQKNKVYEELLEEMKEGEI